MAGRKELSMDHQTIGEAWNSGLGAALVSGFVSLATLLVGMKQAAKSRAVNDRKRAAEQKATIERLALEQSEAAFASIRADVDRYRAEIDRYRLEVDRLREENARIAREAADIAGRLRTVEADLLQERALRQRAEARVAELERVTGGRA